MSFLMRIKWTVECIDYPIGQSQLRCHSRLLLPAYARVYRECTVHRRLYGILLHYGCRISFATVICVAICANWNVLTVHTRTHSARVWILKSRERGMTIEAGRGVEVAGGFQATALERIMFCNLHFIYILLIYISRSQFTVFCCIFQFV